MRRTTSTKYPNRLGLGLAVAAVFIVSSSIGSAQTAGATNAPPKHPWETTAAAGVTLTSGNSETLLATLTLDTKHKAEKAETLAGIAAGYGQSEATNPDNSARTEKNTEFFNAFGQFNYLFSERFYAGLRLDGSYDGIAELDYRIRISPLAGYYLIKKPKTSLSAESSFDDLPGRHPTKIAGWRLAFFPHRRVAFGLHGCTGWHCLNASRVQSAFRLAHSAFPIPYDHARCPP